MTGMQEMVDFPQTAFSVLGMRHQSQGYQRNSMANPEKSRVINGIVRH